MEPKPFTILDIENRPQGDWKVIGVDLADPDSDRTTWYSTEPTRDGAVEHMLNWLERRRKAGWPAPTASPTY